MAGITRTLTFAEGVETGGPTTTFLQTTEFAVFANDAAYVSSKGAAAEDGDTYYNSTDHVIRFYKNGSWTTIYDAGNSDVVTLTDTQTLTNKRLTLPKINEDVALSSTATELNQLDGVSVGGNTSGDILTTDDTQTLTNKTYQIGEAVNLTSNSTELNQLDGISVGGNASGDILTTDGTQTLTNKTLTSPSINGSNLNFGTASNTNRILLPNDTTTNLDSLTDTGGLFAYDTTLSQVVYNNGAGWVPLASSSKAIAIYKTSSGQAVTSGNRIDFNTLVYDPDTLVTTGGSWVFTAPFAGNFMVFYFLRTNAVAITTANQYFGVGIVGTGASYQLIHYTQAAGTYAQTSNGSAAFNLAATNTIYLSFLETVPAVNLSTSSASNYIVIMSI